MVAEKRKKNILKGIMKENDVSQEKLAEVLGMSLRWCNKKVNNFESFTIGEALIMKAYFGKKTMDELFFKD